MVCAYVKEMVFGGVNLPVTCSIPPSAVRVIDGCCRGEAGCER